MSQIVSKIQRFSIEFRRPAIVLI